MFSQIASILRKVVGKSARNNPERYCKWFEFIVLQRNLKKQHKRPWMYMYVCKC